MKIKVIQNKRLARNVMHMSGFRAYLGGCISYKDLIDTFGEPTFTPEDSGDGKVNYEWVFRFDDSYFSVYDWKTYDEEYTRNEYTNWHIGSHAGAIDTNNFINAVLDQMRESLFA
jgi:hypothetical protein